MTVTLKESGEPWSWVGRGRRPEGTRPVAQGQLGSGTPVGPRGH